MFSELLRLEKGLAGCEVLMPDMLKKAETASSQKCTVKEQGQWAQAATEKILTGYKRKNKINYESD